MKFERHLSTERYLLTENFSQAWVENQFTHWTREIWGERSWEFLKGRISFTTVREDYLRVAAKGKQSPVMAVIHAHPGGKAIGNSLISVAKWYKVYISDRMLKLKDKVKAIKIIKHEVIHIGYGKHDGKFRDMCKTWGAAQTELHAGGGGFELQVRIKPRKWVTIEIFDDMDEAVRAGKIMMKNDAAKETLRKLHKIQDEKIRLSVRG